MSAQELLTLLFNAMPKAVRFATIALAFITIATLDFISGLMPLMPRYKMPLISPGQLTYLTANLNFSPCYPTPGRCQ